MSRFLIFPALASMLCFTIPAQADPIPVDLGKQVKQGFIAPTIVAFGEAASHAANNIEVLCSTPDAEHLQNAHQAFSELVQKWGRASILRFGPLQSQNRFERIFFWPDPRGVIVRQVQGLLADKDEGALTIESLSAKSVAVQGLSALEFVLYGAGAEELLEEPQSYRCKYGLTIARTLTQTAEEFAQEWRSGSAFHDDFTTPGTGNALYRSQKEVAAEIVKAIGTGLQFIRSAELQPALGEDADKARGKRAPLWRSNLTFALVKAQLAGLSDLLDTSGFSKTDEAVRSSVDSIEFDLRHAKEALNAISKSAEIAFADSEDREKIRYVTVALETANKALGNQLSGALGLTMGFNALDGD